MNLPRLSEPIDFCYDRTKSEIGIVHLGIGAFHRAHQAVYTDEVLDRFGGDWAICGVSLRSPEMRDAWCLKTDLPVAGTIRIRKSCADHRLRERSAFCT